MNNLPIISSVESIDKGIIESSQFDNLYGTSKMGQGAVLDIKNRKWNRQSLEVNSVT